MLRASDIQALPGLPQGLTQQGIDRSSLTVDPDPRAPCGAKITQPSFQRGALRLFANRTNGSTLIQWANRLPPGRAAAYIDDLRADARPGCRDYETTTSTGSRQMNHFVGAVALPTLDDQRLAVLMRVGNRGGAGAGIAAIALRRRDCMTEVIVFARNEPPHELVRALAVKTAKRFDLLPEGAC
jgi:hypothetical protein